MANYLDKSGLTYLWGKIKGTFATQEMLSGHTGNTTVHITGDERTKWNAAEANVITSVTVNGTALAVADKAVNIDLSNYATKADTSSAITTAISALDVNDTAEANQYVSAVSQTDGKISVSRTALPVSGVTGFYLTNTNGYISLTKVGGTADDNLATVSQVNAAIAGGVQYRGAITDLPTGTPSNGDMYKATTGFIVSGTGTSAVTAKAGDVIIYHTSGTPGWDVIPSGDDVEFTGVKVKAGTTTTDVITATAGGDVTFAAGSGLSVGATGSTVTYSHGAVSGASAVTSQTLYKFTTDEFGHVNGKTAASQSDITSLLGNYVTTFGGKTGAITLKAADTTNPGSVNLAISDTNELSASIHGLGSAAYTDSSAYQPKFTDGSATIATNTDGIVKLTAGVAQTGGKISATDTTITLAKVATSGAASDVTATEVTGSSSTTVQDILSDLATKIGAINVGVTSFGGQEGAITVDTTNATPLGVKFAMNSKQLTGTVNFTNGSATIASKSGNTVTLKTGVAQSNGTISNATGTTDISLAAVAVTGAASDVKVTEQSGITGSTVQVALENVCNKVNGLTTGVSSVAAETGDTALISATTTSGAVTLTSTDKLKNAVTKVEGISATTTSVTVAGTTFEVTALSNKEIDAVCQ